MPFSLLLDVLVAVLLVFTIAYAILLNRRLGALRKDKTDLEKLAGTFAQATVRAEESIGRLKVTADALQDSIDRAEALREDLAFLIDRGGSAADRLEGAVRAARKEGELHLSKPPADIETAAAASAAAEPRGVEPRGVEPRGMDTEPRQPAAVASGGKVVVDDSFDPEPRSEAERELLKALKAAR